MDITLDLGETLTELLAERNISNQRLANDIGVHVTTVQRWKRNAKYLHLSHLLKLADYFHCSLDFLVGRTENMLDYVPRECPPFYPRLREVMKEKDKTRYRISKETKIKDSYFTEWGKGTNPHILSLIEIANYLDVSLDYLVGRDR